MSTQLKCKAMTDEERLSWNGYKVDFDQFARGSARVIMALVDCKKRKLYREEYGDISWDKFMAVAPWFQLRDWGSSRRRQFKAAVNEVEQLATTVTNSLLAGLTEGAIRALRSTVQNPVWRGELLNFMVEQGVQKEDIGEGTIDRYYPRFLQAKEAEEEERKAESQIGFGGDGGGICAVEEDETEEDVAEELPSETASEAAVKHAAKKTEKRPEYFARWLEYGRLMCKNGYKIDDLDLDTPEAQQAASEMLDRIDEINSGIRSKLRRAEEKEVSA